MYFNLLIYVLSANLVPYLTILLIVTFMSLRCYISDVAGQHTAGKSDSL